MFKRFLVAVACAVLFLASPAIAGSYIWPDGSLQSAPDVVIHSPAHAAVQAATPVAASGLVLSATPRTLLSLQVTSGAAAGFAMVFNATSAPADGTVTPVICHEMAATSTWEMPVNPLQPPWFNVGVSVVYSSTGCFTKTASATAFISGQVQ